MKQSTIKKYTEILSAAKNSGKNLKTFCTENGLSYNNISSLFSNLRKEQSDETKELIDLYNDITHKNVEELETDDIAETSITRNEEGKITSYNYKIFRKNKSPLLGNLSREEMNLIYRLYSYYGDSLTQRTISRHFVELSLIDFKRILRAFNITKACSPFAPHMYEEYTEKELREIQLREKENSFLRKAEEDQIKNNEKLLKKYAQENIDLKDKLKKAQFSIELDKVTPYTIEVQNNSDRTINLYLADMHIGAAVCSGALYKDNVNYGKDEVIRRLKCIIKSLTEIGPFGKINLVLVGDNIDCCGIYGRTARLDHEMPENMDPREQANTFLSVMRWFISSLVTTFKCEFEIFSVPCGNHAGNFEYICNKALMSAVNVEFPNIKTTLWEDFYGVFEVNGLRFICTHGKDLAFMKKPMPLNMNDKTQIMLYEWLDSQHIYGDNIHFIKGDLHSNALSSCKKLSYRNVLSLFGASDYSDYNYSKNSYGLSYDIISGFNLMRGTIENM